jgi:opacity protein-like surface antigen
MANKWFTATAIAVGLVAVPTAASADSQIRVFGGLNMTQDIDTSYLGYDAELEADNGYVIGAAFGISAGNWLFEGEVAHRDADISEVQFLTYYAYDIEGSINATSGLINAWYNFDTGSSWGFYAGGGIGVANAEFEVDGYSDDSTEFAWQLGAGATYRMESGFGIGFGYRYFNIDEVADTGSSVTSHDFLVEVSRRF